ncbi:MAG: MBL fold metallo-hydrolase [Gemmatimonadota bacterium]|nr:MBL fold metallo-hydrolase [Gemmatimonadota bacterium]MDH3458458.1 MBL fold metallo-hydrolase [Gemmatimonadota bacterium]
MRNNTPFVIMLAASLAACSPAAEEAAPAETAEAAAPAITAFSAGENVSPFAIGSLQAAALKDAAFAPANDNRTLAVNQTKAAVDAVLTAAGLGTDALELSVQPLIVRTADRVLLFDTGNGPTGMLSASMATAGVAPAAVTDIFISHSHGDHVGGLVGANGALAFPNAAVHISANEWAAMQANAQLAALVTAVTPRVATFAPGAVLVPGTVTAVDIQGHTPGHSGYVIASGEASLLYIGDTMHHWVISVQRPDWTIAFDGDALLAQESRKAVLASSAASGQRVYAVHFPFPGLGTFENRGGTFMWVAE